MGSKHYLEIQREYGKVEPLLDEQLKSVEWGEYRFDKIFRLCGVKNKLTKSELDVEGRIPVYSSESTNNGIIGYTTKNAEFIVDKKTPVYIVFGDHTRNFNIATESFCVADNVKVLTVDQILSIRVLLYIVSSWKKIIPNKGYSRHWSIAKTKSFNLPTKNNKIDFDFMESFIAQIEAERMAQLQTYLEASGLDDYHISDEEQRALDGFKDIEFEEFSVIDVFDVKNAGNILSRDIVKDSGETPYLCASSENNGVSSYISYDESYIDKGNCIFIGGKTFVVSYQEKDFYSNDSHNLVLYLKNEEKRSKLNQLYLATCINKSLGYKYSWGDSISNRKIQKDKVSLPTQNNQPNYEQMQTLISAIQKIVIRDVVGYTDQKLS